MEVVYAEATLVVSRSGGMTAELTTVGMPSVLVPLPGAPGDHQTANADALVAAGAAVMIPDAELDAGRLAAELDALLADPARLDAMSAAAAHARPARRHRPLRRPGRSASVATEAGAMPADLDLTEPHAPIHVVGVGRRGHERASPPCSRAWATRVSGSDLRDSPLLERLRLLGVDHARRPRGREPPRCARRGGDLHRDPEHATPRWSPRRARGIPVLRRADALRRDRRDPHDRRGRREPRQDHHVVDARADPARRRAGTRAS